MKFLALVLELIWFAAGLFCVLGGIRHLTNGDKKTGFIFIIFAAVSFFMFFIRRLRRISKK